MLIKDDLDFAKIKIKYRDYANTVLIKYPECELEYITIGAKTIVFTFATSLENSKTRLTELDRYYDVEWAKIKLKSKNLAKVISIPASGLHFQANTRKVWMSKDIGCTVINQFRFEIQD